MKQKQQIGKLIAEISGLVPEWRYGQIVANAVRAKMSVVVCDPFYMEDEDMIESLEVLLEKVKSNK